MVGGDHPADLRHASCDPLGADPLERGQLGAAIPTPGSRWHDVAVGVRAGYTAGICDGSSAYLCFFFSLGIFL